MATRVKTEVAALRDEGDRLFVRADWQGAYLKYSEAIELDPLQSILFQNRSACGEKMQKWLNVKEDAHRAILLHSNCTQAWARLAEACFQLGDYMAAIRNWRGAIDSLPHSGWEREDIVEKREDYKERMDEAGRRGAKKTRELQDLPTWDVPEEELPIARALARLPRIVAKECHHSSAWVLVEANAAIRLGIQRLSEQEPSQRSNNFTVVSRDNTIQCFSLAVVRDSRVYPWIPKILEEKVRDQLYSELDKSKGWFSGTANEVMKEVKKRLRTQKWDQAVCAVSVTVHAWILRAIDAHEVKKNYGLALALWGEILEILTSCNALTLDIPVEHCGEIFQRPFIRGVKVLRLETYAKGYLEDRQSAFFSLDRMGACARDVINDVRTDPKNWDVLLGPDHFFAKDTPYTSGSKLSFWTYPLGKATAALGYVECGTAEALAAQVGHDDKKVKEHWHQSAIYYSTAASELPLDEELRSGWMYQALYSYRRAEAPLRTTLPLVKKLQLDFPKMHKIWENSLSCLEDGTEKVDAMLAYYNGLIDAAGGMVKLEEE